MTQNESDMDGTSNTPRTMTVGHVSAAFRELDGWLREAGAWGQIDVVDALPTALSTLASRVPAPDFVIVYQDYPGQYAEQDVSTLIGVVPGAVVLCICSEWCGSAARTHDDWPVTCRVSLGDSVARLSRELAEFCAGVPALLPLVAAEDVFAAQANAGISPEDLHGWTAFIVTTDADTVAMLRRLLPTEHIQWSGAASTVSTSSSATADSLLFLVDADVAELQISTLVDHRTRGSIVVALTGYPGRDCPAWADLTVCKSHINVQVQSIGKLLKERAASRRWLRAE
jgi:hypothetical protein